MAGRESVSWNVKAGFSEALLAQCLLVAKIRAAFVIIDSLI